MMGRVSLCINGLILHSLTYDVIDVMDDDNFVTTLEDHIQISVALTGTVSKTLIEPIVLAK